MHDATEVRELVHAQALRILLRLLQVRILLVRLCDVLQLCHSVRLLDFVFLMYSQGFVLFCLLLLQQRHSLVLFVKFLNLILDVFEFSVRVESRSIDALDNLAEVLLINLDRTWFSSCGTR